MVNFSLLCDVLNRKKVGQREIFIQYMDSKSTQKTFIKKISACFQTKRFIFFQPSEIKTNPNKGFINY